MPPPGTIWTLYGTPAKFSYYNGCSQGGRQGLAAAQTYPDDFNAIVAGAAAWNSMAMHGARTALNFVVNKDKDSVIPPAKYPMIHEAVLNACDALDGVKDGVIENPSRCTFDYATLLCKSGDGADCLTNGQVASAKAMTSPLKRGITPEEVANAAVFLCSPLASAITGEVLFVDCGYNVMGVPPEDDIKKA